MNLLHFGRPFVKRFALCYETFVMSVLSVCLSVCLCGLPVLSVTLVYCGQTVGCIKIKLGIQVGLGPGHTVLDGDSALRPPKGQSLPFLLADVSRNILDYHTSKTVEQTSGK